MIITLTRADFSSCKIGTLTTFNVRKSTVIGASINIIKTSVERAGYSSATTIATIVLDEANYEGHAIKVMMGSTDVSSWYSLGNVIVPANTPITSNITISVSATAINTGEVVDPEEPGTDGDSDGVIENKRVLYNNYTLNENKTLGPSGIAMSEKTGYHTYEMIPVEPNTAYYIPGGVRVSLLNSTQNPTTSINIWSDSNVGQQCYILTNETAAYAYITILDSKISIEEAYIQKAASSVNIAETSVISELTGTEFIDNVKLNSSNYIEASDTTYCVWKNIPIKPNTNYKVAGAARNWYLTEDGSTCGTFNPTKNGVPEKFGFITPRTAASVSISIYKPNMDKSADELELIELQTTYTPIE